MTQHRVSTTPAVKLRWYILFPIIAIIILTISLMVKEYKDQKVRDESATISFYLSEESFM